MKTKLKTIGCLAIGTLLLLAAGCQTRPSYTAKPGFDFSHYQTYALLPLPTDGPNSDPSASARLARVVRNSVTDSLARKGFREAAPDTADFLVKVESYFRSEHDDTRWEYRRLTIDILDRKQQEVVWSNWGARVAGDTLSPELLQQRLATLLEPFPPGRIPTN